MIRVAAIAGLFLLFGGCGKRPVGEYCAQSAECADGTSCVLSGSRDIVDGGLSCDETKKLCSITCSEDADCAALGAGHICVKECFMGSCLKGSH